MTIMIGARCKDGVVLVSDRRSVRLGGLETQSPACKLRVIRGLLVGRVGMFAFHDAVERSLEARLADGSALASAWDLAEAANDTANHYEGFKDERPLFPVADRVNDKAMLWQVTGGFPPGNIEYEAWGGMETYAAIGRIFRWKELLVDEAWRAMLVMIAIASKVSVGAGDGADVAIARDNSAGFEIREYADPQEDSLMKAYQKACKWVDSFQGEILDHVMRSTPDGRRR